MFEGITTTFWLSFMAGGAFGAALIGLIRTGRTRLIWLALWLLVPGLIGGVTSSPDTLNHLVGLVILTELFLGVPWAFASLLAFAVVRLIARLRRRREARETV